MAVTNKLYGQVGIRLGKGEIAWKASGGDTIKCALVTSSYTFDQDAHDYFDDVSAYEVSGTGYIAGGAAVTLSDPTYDAATNEVRFDCSDVLWPNSTITARGAVFYKDTGTASSSPLICFVDFGENLSTSNTEFKITIGADGLFKITIAS